MRKIIYLIIFIIIVMSITSYIIYTTSFSPAPLNLEKCITLQKNTEIGADIVLFAESQKKAEKYVDYFLSSDPFTNNKAKFNFYYMKDYIPYCELYKNIALLCYSRNLIKTSGSCPNDQIVVLNNEFPREIRSSNYLNVMSINTNHPMSVLLHEFGHSFVALAEEYTPAKIPSNSAGNCVDKCEKFEGRNNGCYKGCSREDYMRSIDNGIMRTLNSEDYGNFNKWIITNKIAKLSSPSSAQLSGKVIDSSNCEKQKYYLIEGNKTPEAGINIVNKSIEEGCAGDPGAGGYIINIILKDDKKLNIGEFNPELIYTDAPGDETQDTFLSPIEGETYMSDVNFFLKVPVVENAKELQIREPGLKITVATPLCENAQLGDVNGDGKLDYADVAHLEEHFEGNILYCQNAADYNKDGRISIEDAYSLTDALGGARISLED